MSTTLLDIARWNADLKPWRSRWFYKLAWQIMLIHFEYRWWEYLFWIVVAVIARELVAGCRWL